MNFKKIGFVLIAMTISSCEPTNTIQVFDHAEQYEIEKPIIENYLNTHYYDNIDHEIKDLDANQVALSDDANLQVLSDTINDVVYEMYSYVYEQGSQDYPDQDDTVKISYSLCALDGTFYEEIDNNFISLLSYISGWRIGLVVFRGGVSSETDSSIPRQYSETGKGFMIIPSGLGYQNIGKDFVGPNETLVFKINLKTVVSVGDD